MLKSRRHENPRKNDDEWDVGRKQSETWYLALFLSRSSIYITDIDILILIRSNLDYIRSGFRFRLERCPCFKTLFTISKMFPVVQENVLNFAGRCWRCPES